MEGPKKRLLVSLLALIEGPKPLLAPMKGPKQRKFWSDEMIKVLLDKCIKEMNSTGRNGTSLHKQSWARLGWVFKEKFNIDFNQKDIKNGFDNLKAKYFGWLYLKNKTGNLYNPDTKMFNLTQEEWEDFKQIEASASVSAASASGESASGASAIKESVEHSIWMMTLWLMWLFMLMMMMMMMMETLVHTRSMTKLDLRKKQRPLVLPWMT
uniref:Myb/SANT-like domain, Harbinger transposase-derived nuclease domain protein n=1 Tax=Tanacetum cinerariifolium TaxID=118510 RepID=A0A699JXF7_TANCI|nr:myb/SANT-like domain, Harbinger transposase-derived nuclease domain protein [Tanacetum cinerariifolium]